MAVQHLPSFATPMDVAPSTVAGCDDSAAAAAYYTPYCLASFLEGNSRPLAWRSGLPPSASGHAGLFPSKGLHNDVDADDHGHDLRGLHGHHHHRRSQDSLERLRYDMHDFLKAMVWANHDMLRMRPSQLEGPQTRAVYVKGEEEEAVPGFGFGGSSSARHVSGPMPPWLAATAGEHLHIHPDGSAHMILSLADATTAVECGWAERPQAGHVFGSVDGGMGYATIHAPRDRAELAEWKKLALASVRYCTYSWTGMEIRRPERV